MGSLALASIPASTIEQVAVWALSPWVWLGADLRIGVAGEQREVYWSLCPRTCM